MPRLTAVTLGSFARELVLQLEPLEDLLASWEITPADYNDLRKSKFFQNEVKAAVAEVKAMGPDAGFITRAKILSEDFLGDMVGLMQDGKTPPEVKVKLFEQMTSLGRLQPAKNHPGNDRPSGPQVVFNFGAGMPGLPTTLEITPEPAEPLPAPSE